MSGDRTCIRLGCDRPRFRRGEGKRYGAWCSGYCRKWHRAFTAFTEDGAAVGRNAHTDAVLFAGVFTLGVSHPRCRETLNELFDVYGRAS
jgi:hypothetical protein